MESMAALYAAIIAILSIFCYSLLFKSSSKAKPSSEKPPPPEVGGARLFTGHLHLMAGAEPHITLSSLADKYGPLFTIRVGVRRLLVVSSFDVARELFTTHDAAVSSRPDLRVTRYLTYDNAMFAFTPYGPYWREIRKLVAAELLSARRMELQRSVRVSETAQFITELYELWEKKKDGSGRVLVDMKQWFGNLNLNVILRMVVGKRLYDGDNAEETQRIRKAMREFFYLGGQFLPGDALPYLRLLDLGGLEKKMKRAGVELEKIVGGWLAEHRRKGVSGEDKQPDFMDVMISSVDADNDLQAHYDADNIIKATCQVLISGGTDTTTVALIWALSLLLNNRRTLKKAQQELDEVVGRERRVDESDINNLVYLQAIVKESLRLYPASPLGGPRLFTKDCNVNGYHVPKGTWMAVNIWKVLRDPKVWPDEPLEFKPERFLQRLKNVDATGVECEMMAFGGGRRICPGVNLGVCMLHLVLANLLQAFDLTTVGDEQVDMTGSAGLTSLKVTPLDVLVAPRLSPNLYL